MYGQLIYVAQELLLRTKSFCMQLPVHSISLHSARCNILRIGYPHLYVRMTLFVLFEWRFCSLNGGSAL